MTPTEVLSVTNTVFARLGARADGLDFNGLGGHYRVRRDFLAYKLCVSVLGDEDVVVTLRIPRGALVFLTQRPGAPSTVFDKCRASSAWVVALDGRRRRRARSFHTRTFTYELGKRVAPLLQFSRANRQCASGIHFFLARPQAEAFVY